MSDDRLEYAFYAGCCFQGGDARWLEIFEEVMGRLDVGLHVLHDAVCCGSGVLEERSELTSLVLNARTLALAEKTGMPLFIPCATCYNVIANCRIVLQEDERLRRNVNDLLREEGLEFRDTCRLTTPLWAIAFDVGLERLAARTTTDLTGLRVGAFYGCHLRNPRTIQSYEPADHCTSLENILRVLGVDLVDYGTADECCGYHLSWPNRQLSLRMTANVLRDVKQRDIDVLVTACPLCFKSLDGAQPRAMALVGRDDLVPVIFLPQIVGLACGMTGEEVGLDWHVVPINLRIQT